MADRRQFMLLLLLGLAVPGTGTAFAKDGGSDGGGDSGGGDGGGDSDGGSDNSGSGSNGSGKSGSGKNGDSGKDDSGKDDSKSEKKDSKDSRSRKDKKDDDDDDDDRIRSAVKSGKAEPLGKILSKIRAKYNGQVVRIRLTGSGNNLQYRIRMIVQNDKLIELRVNAKTAQVLGSTGL